MTEALPIGAADALVARVVCGRRGPNGGAVFPKVLEAVRENERRYTEGRAKLCGLSLEQFLERYEPVSHLCPTANGDLEIFTSVQYRPCGTGEP